MSENFKFISFIFFNIFVKIIIFNLIKNILIKNSFKLLNNINTNYKNVIIYL